jgi:DNA-binding response OmpR family regulator
VEDSQTERILVVDDDDAIRGLVERVLRRERYDVDTARDGFEAIEKLARHDYGTVLLDLMMPRIDGLGVLNYLENARADDAPAVIIMTANLHSIGEVHRKSTVAGVLPKPFDLNQLLEHVRQLAEAPDAAEPQP